MRRRYRKITGGRWGNIRNYEAEKLCEDEAFVVIYPKTKKASILYGKGTQWCTASKQGSQFRYYNRMGKLYIIIDKRTGKKYQFHAETRSFMNEEDEAINTCVTDTNGQVIYNRIENWGNDTLKKINATEGLNNYFSTLFSYMHVEYMIDQHKQTLWDMYCEIYYNGQLHYIVRESNYYALYNAHFEEIIGEPFGAEKIIPFKDRENQLIVIKNNYTGIFNIDTNTIRWGYKGVVDERIDWIRR